MSARYPKKSGPVRRQGHRASWFPESGRETHDLRQAMVYILRRVPRSKGLVPLDKKALLRALWQQMKGPGSRGCAGALCLSPEGGGSREGHEALLGNVDLSASPSTAKTRQSRIAGSMRGANLRDFFIRPLLSKSG
jgi:hypothetical protein